MKNRIILFTLVLLSNVAISQTDFKKGYVLLTENDTVYGYINNKNYYRNSLSCDFKKNKDDSVKHFFPKDIFGYRFINGKYYISKNIKYNNKDTCFFFEYLIKGKLNFYFLQDKYFNNYYISNDGIILNKLKYVNDYVYVENQMIHRDIKQFIGLLDYYTKDCPEIKKDIRKIQKPSHQDLINLSKKYNELTCPDRQCIIYEKKIPHKIKFETFSEYNYCFNKQLTDKTFSSYSIGFNVLIQLFEQKERFFGGVGLRYDSNSYIYSDKFSIPLSIYYLHPKKEFSPMYKISIDLLRPDIQHFGVGVRYKYKKLSFFTLSEIQTYIFILPGFSQRVGFFINLNQTSD